MTLSAGCQIYFDIDDGDGDGWVPDAGVGYPDAGGCYDMPPPYDPGLELRNPYTGLCEYYGPYDPCSPQPQPPPPPWGMCQSECSAFDFDEAGCLSAPGCRAAYVEAPYLDGPERSFLGCWAIGYGGAPDLECEGLDAWDCSMREDCSAVHEGLECYPDASGQLVCWETPFLTCISEPAGGCTDDSQCGSGYRCDVPVDCVQVPECASEPSLGCTGCTGVCVPVGSCHGEVFCDAEPPACPPDSVAAVADGCWTGACIPVEQCEPAPVVCSDLGSEDECLAYDGCVPVYNGENCSCSDSGCTCETWVFARCEGSDPTMPLH